MITDVLKLEETCSCCGGSGEVLNQEAAELNDLYNKKIETFLGQGMNRSDAMDAADNFFEDEGREIPWKMVDIYPCIDCDGKGTTLTDEGWKLIQILRKYL